VKEGMVATGCSEKLVNNYQTTRRHIPEENSDNNNNHHHWQNAPFEP
jgi:hypothetical protein